MFREEADSLRYHGRPHRLDRGTERVYDGLCFLFLLFFFFVFVCLFSIWPFETATLPEVMRGSL